MKRAIVFAVILICTPLCLATTIHVPADQPTIQAGMDAAMTGDIVSVAPGSYSEQINFKGKGIVVTSSDGPEVTFLNPSGTPVVSFVNSEPTGAEISGFTFRSTGGYQLVKITSGALPLIRGNIFTNLSTGDVLIFCEGSYPRIVQNLFYDNETGHACIGVSSGAADIINNTFDRNGRGFYSYGNTVAKNNIVTNSAQYGIYGSYSELSYNDVWNNNSNYEGGAVAGEGSISQDPLYVDYANGDYNLEFFSPCVDAGDPHESFNDPDGTRCDMGAFADTFQYPFAAGINFGPQARSRVVFTLTPEIYWTFLDTASTSQVAYELQIGTDKDWTLAEMWNTGTVTSDSGHVTYGGSSPTDNTTYFLRLRVFNGIAWGGWVESYFRTHVRRTVHVPVDYTTIQAAIDGALDWDTILVAPGTYSGDVDFLGKSIVMRSEAGAAFTILQSSEVHFTSGEDTTSIIDGFGITGRVHGIYISQSSPIVMNCDVSQCSWDGDGGGIFVQESRAKIRNNSIHDNKGTVTGGGIYIYNCISGFEISGNTIYNNTAPHGSGIGAFSGGFAMICRNVIFHNQGDGEYAAGVYMGECERCDIINNTIVDNPRGITWLAESGLHILNNIVARNSGKGISQVFLAVDHNDVWANGGGNIPGTDGISVDPLFVDADENDYHLLPDSPCIDAGNPGTQYNDPDSSRNDIGAFWLPKNYPFGLHINYGPQSQDNVVRTLVPEIHWTFVDSSNTSQTAYELQVGTDRDWTTAEMWSTGQVESSFSDVIYDGSLLQNRTIYYLRLRVNNGYAWGDWNHSSFIVHTSSVIQVPTELPTIQGAIDAAVTGDTVLAAPGIYREQLNFKGKRIVVTSSDGSRVTFLQQAYTPAVQFVSGESAGTELSGFTMKVIQGSKHIRISNGAEPLIQGNIFAGLVTSDVLIYSSDSHPKIVRNLFRKNTGYACIGIENGDADIVNNTFDGNSRGISSNGNTVAKNNIVTNSTGSGIEGSYSDLSYNDVWNNHPDYGYGIAAGIGSLSKDPLYRDPTGHNYWLEVSSPCVDAGDPDFAYNDPDGTRNDMGAFSGGFVYPVCREINYGAESMDNLVFTLIPEIHWIYYDTSSTQQVAFEMEVGTDLDWTVAELWNSGVVTSTNTEITYSGSPLVDDSTFYLRLRAYNGSRWGEWTEDYFHIHIIKSIHIPADQPSIQAGINAAVNRDTVLVAPGSYSESINFGGKDIVVTTVGGPDVTFLNPSGTPIVSFANGEPSSAELSGFTLQSTGGSQHIRITSFAEPLIQGNIFKNLTTNDVLIYSEGMHPRIVRNLFYNNSTGWACIGIASGAADIINNTFDGNRRGFYSYGSTVAKNNIVTNSLEYGIAGSYSELSYNDVWKNNPDYQGGAVAGEGSLAQDPLYVDCTNGDYRLKITSPCINSGNPDPKYNDPDGSRNDMGAIPFRVNHVPSAVALVSPSNTLDTAITTIRPTFSWTASIDPDVDDTVGYCLMIAVDSNFAFVQIVANLSSTNYTLPTDLLWGHRYWWKVKSADLYGGVNWSTQVFHFRTMTLGDASNDETVNVVDLVYLVNYIFSGGQPPIPLSAGDINCDGRINIADCVYLINYVFVGGPAPCARGK